MYSGKNPSALRSQQWLADSLVDLMKVKEFQYISVKEICQKADLTRQTFYQIFSSKEDVIRYNIMKGCERFKTSLSLHEQVDMETLAIEFFRFFRKEEALVKLLAENHLEYLLTEQFSLALPEIMDICTERKEVFLSNPYLKCFIIGGLLNMILEWIKNGDGTDAEELARLFAGQFISGSDKQ